MFLRWVGGGCAGRVGDAGVGLVLGTCLLCATTRFGCGTGGMDGIKYILYNIHGTWYARICRCSFESFSPGRLLQFPPRRLQIRLPVYADAFCASSATFCSIVLSSSPLSATFFSWPKSAWCVSGGARGRGRERRTVAGVQGGLNAAGLADQDRGVRVVLLHGRVAALEEGPVRLVSSHSPWHCLAGHCLARCLPDKRRPEWTPVPCRGAVVAGLAEEKAQLLQPRVECILGRHRVGCARAVVAVNWSFVEARSRRGTDVLRLRRRRSPAMPEPA